MHSLASWSTAHTIHAVSQPDHESHDHLFGRLENMVELSMRYAKRSDNIHHIALWRLQYFASSWIHTWHKQKLCATPSPTALVQHQALSHAAHSYSPTSFHPDHDVTLLCWLVHNNLGVWFQHSNKCKLHNIADASVVNECPPLNLFWRFC